MEENNKEEKIVSFSTGKDEGIISINIKLDTSSIIREATAKARSYWRLYTFNQKKMGYYKVQLCKHTVLVEPVNAPGDIEIMTIGDYKAMHYIKFQLGCIPGFFWGDAYKEATLRAAWSICYCIWGPHFDEVEHRGLYDIMLGMECEDICNLEQTKEFTILVISDKQKVYISLES